MMVGHDDTLQPVKYLGKVRSLHAHGIGVAIVSGTIEYKFMLNDFV